MRFALAVSWVVLGGVAAFSQYQISVLQHHAKLQYQVIHDQTRVIAAQTLQIEQLSKDCQTRSISTQRIHD
ncbi:MAG: hypothetical protein ABWY12_09635 [Burkholderiales bacterium]